MLTAIVNADSGSSKAHPHPHGEVEDYKHFYHGKEFYDDIYGKLLERDRAIAARKLEMDFFKRMQVHSKVDRNVAKQIGAKIITTRWIDTNKGDDKNPDYRARLVGREIKTDQRPDLFAATPPIESLRMILSICASNQQGTSPYRILSSDIKRAYFFAKAKRPIFIEILVEDKEPGDEGKVGRLNLSLYETRDAAMNWQDEFTTTLVKNEFMRGKASPCNSHHPQKCLHVIVHGDDFTPTGPQQQLNWLRKLLDEAYGCKHQWLGPDSGEEKSVRIPNRIICWEGGGITYEVDPRHVEVVIEQMEFVEAKSASSPGTREEQTKVHDTESDEMFLADASGYRMLIARLKFLSMDRPDIQYSTKEASKCMAKPHQHHWHLLKRIGRYFVEAPRVVQMFNWQSGVSSVEGYSGSDWAGDRSSRKSTSGGAFAE